MKIFEILFQLTFIKKLVLIIQCKSKSMLIYSSPSRYENSNNPELLFKAVTRGLNE